MFHGFAHLFQALWETSLRAADQQVGEMTLRKIEGQPPRDEVAERGAKFDWKEVFRRRIWKLTGTHARNFSLQGRNTSQLVMAIRETALSIARLIERAVVPQRDSKNP